MNVKEESKRASLKLNIKKNLRSWHPAWKTSTDSFNVYTSGPTKLISSHSEYFMKSKALELKGRCYYLMAMFLQAIR